MQIVRYRFDLKTKINNVLKMIEILPSRGRAWAPTNTS